MCPQGDRTDATCVLFTSMHCRCGVCVCVVFMLEGVRCGCFGSVLEVRTIGAKSKGSSRHASGPTSHNQSALSPDTLS